MRFSGPVADWLTLSVKALMPLLVLRHNCLLHRKISVAGLVALYGSPSVATNCTTWLPLVQPRPCVHAPSVSAPFGDWMSLGSTTIPHSGSTVPSPQLSSPTP